MTQEHPRRVPATRNRAIIVVGILLSALGIAYAFRGVDLGDALAAIRQIRMGPFWVSQGFFLLLIVLRAVRWHYLLLKLKRFPFMSLLSASVIGLMANNLLPGRLGELVRSVFLARREGVSSVAILANVVVERVVDVLALLVLLVVYLLLSGAGGGAAPAALKVSWVGSAAAVGLLVGLVVLSRYRSALIRISVTLARPFSGALAERVEGVAASFISGLDVVQNWGQLVIVSVLSLLIWMAGVASYFFLLESFSLHLDFLQVTLVFVVVLLGIALPSAPGHVGTFHALAVGALGLVGVTNAAAATAFASVLHGTQWLMVNILGAIFLFREGRRAWKDIWKV